MWRQLLFFVFDLRGRSYVREVRSGKGGLTQPRPLSAITRRSLFCVALDLRGSF